ncbi:MAG: transposase [Planctomycetaceae bacterium]|nr:transposase [Planctomycetaceae bacterium]
MKRRTYQNERHVHFVTFSCYRRRKFLSRDRCKQIVIGHLGSLLAKRKGLCTAFVIMPDHVHALVWFEQTDQLSSFMQQWKEHSAKHIQQYLEQNGSEYLKSFSHSHTIWQPCYYDFNVWSRQKIEEKLNYLHENPVRAGLVDKMVEYKWSSARWYENRQSVGVPIKWPPGMETDDDFVTSE